MTVEADLVRRFPQLRVVVRTVNVMAGGAGYALLVHHALHKIVALHAVLVGASVRIVVEVRLAERDVFELPVVLQMSTRV